MNSILEEFAKGNISPEPRFFSKNSIYGGKMQELCNLEDKLSSLLNEDEKKLFREFVDAQIDISRLSGIDRFIYGYRLGVLMTTEVFNGKENLTVCSEME